MKIKAIKPVGKQKVYDISVADVEHYLLANGVASHNSGVTYSADNVWIIGRQQDKVGTEVQGYHFVINVEKSRFVKEKSKIPISVSWNGGIDKYSGLLDLGIEAGYIQKPSAQFCQLLDFKTEQFGEGKIRPKAIPDSFFEGLVQYQPFKDFITNKYTMGMRQMISDGSEHENVDVEDDEDS